MSAYPALKPIEARELAAFANVPPGIMAKAGTPPAWPPLVAALNDGEVHQPVLLRALAWGLPVGPRLRWACLAARLEEILSERPKRSQALVLAERWVREGDEGVRYEAFKHAREESALGAAPLVGMAAFVSGPSLAPQGSPADPPPADLPLSSAAGALTATAAASPLGAEGFELVNSIGLEIAAGGDGREAARVALAKASGATATN